MARKTDSTTEQLDPSLVHKKKARRRLVGALAFFGLVAGSLPFILDPEPKLGAPEAQIRVPAREPLAVAPTPDAAEKSATSRANTPPVSPAVPSYSPEAAATKDNPPKPDTAQADSSKADAKTDAKPDTKADAKADAKAQAKPDAKAPAKTEPKSGDAKTDPLKGLVAKADTKADIKADTKTEKKSDAKADSAKADKADSKKDAVQNAKGYSVQIGAYANETSAKEQQDKATGLGLKAYTEKISTPNGQRVRVRIGPFSKKEQAEQAQAKLKSNGIEAAIVSL